MEINKIRIQDIPEEYLISRVTNISYMEDAK
jgi:hypothetical protein